MSRSEGRGPREDGWAARFEDVVKDYAHATSRVRALRGVSATFRPGRITAVAGPSGSGKSTLLRILAGMDRPTSGRVRVRGLDGARPYEVRRAVGYVFQRPSDNFVPHLTVGDHLVLAGAGDGQDVLERLGIGHVAGRLPSELSGGEQQRAAIAQMLIAESRLIVADEPTAELDSGSARALLGGLRELLGWGVTFVLATHDSSVLAVADDVVRLEHGSVVDHRGPAPGPVASPGWAGGWEAAEAPVIEVSGVEKSFPEGRTTVPALRGVDLALHPGEVVGVVGRSGSGKTTLLNVVAEWEHPDRGSVEWAPGMRPAGPPPWDRVAVVPQRLGLLDDLTIRENVEHPARLRGDLGERGERVGELIEALRLDALADRYPREASVGEQQRAAVARALVLDPTVLLADEPTSHQDVASATAVLEAIRDTAFRGTACLIATHNREAEASLDRILEMADGRIVETAGT